MARPLGERCLTHQEELILCESCVIENAMRMRRRLSHALAVVVTRHSPGLGDMAKTWNAAAVIADIEAELLKELPE